MSEQLTNQSLRNAINAAQKYISVKEACRDRHEAFIGVVANGKEQHGVRTVFVEVNDESVEIIVENLHTICDHHTNMFTAENDDISIINRTLRIRPRTSFFSKLVIEITAK